MQNTTPLIKERKKSPKVPPINLTNSKAQGLHSARQQNPQKLSNLTGGLPSLSGFNKQGAKFETLNTLNIHK